MSLTIKKKLSSPPDDPERCTGVDVDESNEQEPYQLTISFEGTTNTKTYLIGSKNESTKADEITANWELKLSDIGSTVKTR